jgi:hypothetical protein
MEQGQEEKEKGISGVNLDFSRPYHLSLRYSFTLYPYPLIYPFPFFTPQQKYFFRMGGRIK